jgi:D-glycero-alpha-D-manno-heptose-7-phosphate kinase
MLMTDPEQRYRVITALNEAGVAASSVQFSEGGAEAWATRS